MELFLAGLFGIAMGATYAFDIRGYSSSRSMPIFTRVLGWVFFIVGILMVFVAARAWIFGPTAGHR